jgi:hypothetical protein
MADMRELSICIISEVFDKEMTHSIGHSDSISTMAADSAISNRLLHVDCAGCRPKHQ